jgi:hypothetical protein
VIFMTEVLTPADQFNLTLIHNMDDLLKKFPVPTYGPEEDPVYGAIECPYTVGKLYKTIAPTYLVQLTTDEKYEPATIAIDVLIPENEVLVFLGAERYFFQQNKFEDNFSIYTLRFLYQDAIYFDLVPARFTEDDLDWTYISNKNISFYMTKVLRGSITPL